MAQVTYNQLIKAFETIGYNHFQINRFGNGVVEDVNTFSPDSNGFPILWVAPQGVELGDNSMIYTMRVLVFDIDKSNDSLRNEILSDCLLILNDVIQILKNDTDNYTVSNNPQAIPFNQKFVDYCTGWFADVNIETDILNTLCVIPRV